MANTIALNAVFEVEPLPHIQRLPDRRWERISFRIPSTLTPDPCVVTADSGHSLISSGSSLSWVFVLVLGIPSRWCRRDGASTELGMISHVFEVREEPIVCANEPIIPPPAPPIDTPPQDPDRVPGDEPSPDPEPDEPANPMVRTSVEHCPTWSVLCRGVRPQWEQQSWAAIKARRLHE
ncbi:hypothetical protein H4W29_005373 [Rhizobium viscosum]|uniref:Uncharacterized protein n=1 Tax=Rhizobium viscosum TaxID=1673 RepID=A0ABR9IY78_RHIVS|nr:hypothetical protein [Rhizobium viscosum]